MFTSKKIGYAIPFFVIVAILTYVYILRASFAPYDFAYYDNLFDHSQYSIAQSHRMIGDSDLYPVTGLRLTKSHDPFRDVPQAPPLGKYIYAISILLFDTPYLVNYIFLIFLLIFSMGIVYRLCKSWKITWLGCLVLVTYPQVVAQLGSTMLDILQATFIFAHIYYLDKCASSEKRRGATLFVSGVLLGLYSVTKFSPLTFVILILDIWYLRKHMYIYQYVYLIVGWGIGCLIPFLPYLIDHSILQLLKNQKWVLQFWREGNNSPPFFGMPFISIISGMYHHFSPGTKWEYVQDWSPIVAVMILIIAKDGLTYLRKISLVRLCTDLRDLFHRPTLTNYLFLFAGVQMIVFSFIPFYTRYLLPVVVVIIMVFMAHYLDRVNSLKIVLLIVLSFLLSIYWLYIPPKPFAESIAYRISNGLYIDLCQDIYKETLSDSDCRAFQSRIHKDIHDAGITKTNMYIEYVDGNQFSSNIQIHYSIRHTTPIGLLQQKGTMEAKRDGRSLKLKWNDEHLISGYKMGDKLTSSFYEGTKGKYIRNGVVIYEDIDRDVFVVWPDKLASEEDAISYLESHTSLSDFEIRAKFLINHTPNLPAVIGEVSTRKNLYPLPKGIELRAQRHNTGLEYSARTGGKITLTKRDGHSIVLLEQKMKDGKQVTE